MKNVLMALLFTAPVFAAESWSAHHDGGRSGRYQVTQISEFRRDQFLIDTETGKLWVHTCLAAGKDGNGDSCYWAAESVQGITKPDPFEASH